MLDWSCFESIFSMSAPCATNPRVLLNEHSFISIRCFEVAPSLNARLAMLRINFTAALSNSHVEHMTLIYCIDFSYLQEPQIGQHDRSWNGGCSSWGRMNRASCENWVSGDGRASSVHLPPVQLLAQSGLRSSPERMILRGNKFALSFLWLLACGGSPVWAHWMFSPSLAFWISIK